MSQKHREFKREGKGKVLRAKTVQVSSETLHKRAEEQRLKDQTSMASQVLKSLTKAGRSDVSVKGYIGSYNALSGRVIPDTEHAREKQPKAIRTNPSI